MFDKLCVVDVTRTVFVNFKTLLFNVLNLQPQWRRCTLTVYITEYLGLGILVLHQVYHIDRILQINKC